MQTGQVLRFDPFRLDAGNARLWRGRQLMALTPKAFAVLCHLVLCFRNSVMVFGRDLFLK